jgi:hypothetical protein
MRRKARRTRRAVARDESVLTREWFEERVGGEHESRGSNVK